MNEERHSNCFHCSHEASKHCCSILSAPCSLLVLDPSQGKLHEIIFLLLCWHIPFSGLDLGPSCGQSFWPGGNSAALSPRTAHGGGARAGDVPPSCSCGCVGRLEEDRIIQVFFLMRISTSPFSPEGRHTGRTASDIFMDYLTRGIFVGWSWHPWRLLWLSHSLLEFVFISWKCTNLWLEHQAVTFSHLYTCNPPVPCLSLLLHTAQIHFTQSDYPGQALCPLHHFYCSLQ